MTAGENIRKLALRRTIKAYTYRIGGIANFILIFVLIIGFRSSSAIALALPCFFLGVVWLDQSQKFFRLAAYAEQGAIAEEEVSLLLSSLTDRGWKAEYNVKIPRWGDADIFLISPKNNAFVIDVKSHKGTVVFENKKLARRYEKQSYPFEKDFLKAVKGQAIALKKAKKKTFITPLLCFSQANLNIQNKSKRVNGVFITTSKTLISTLEWLEREN
ncbi:MAG: nuclease-related domain-containing protein [Cyanobacteria bacterium P01_E01_bin.42]